LADLENSFTRHNDEYPTSLNQAYDFLVNYRDPNKYHSQESSETGLTFYQSEEGQSDQADRAGRGQGRGGGGRGRGKSGGRQQTQQDNNAEDHGNEDDQARVNDGDGGADLEDDNPSSEAFEFYPHSHNIANAETFVQREGKLPMKWILLDSCSSVNLISDDTLLTDIHQTSETLTVHCNAGKVTVNQKGYFDMYPEPVWYNPKGIANILSLKNIASHYHVRGYTITPSIRN